MGASARWPRLLILVGGFGLAGTFFLPTHYVNSIHDPDSPIQAAGRLIADHARGSRSVPVSARAAELGLLVLPSIFGLLLAITELRAFRVAKGSLYAVLHLWALAGLLMLTFPVIGSDRLLGALLLMTLFLAGLFWSVWLPVRTHEEFLEFVALPGALICQLAFARTLAENGPGPIGITVGLVAAEMVLVGGLYRRRVA